jgi:subtilisin-like proprotein convertase family protein
LPSGPQHYDALIHDGGAGAQSFTFTSGAAVGQQVEATLELVDNGLDPVYKTNVSFIFYPPNTSYRTNANPISIPDHGIGLPYPSSITISTLFGLVTNATVTLQNLNHSFPHDISVLLVSPAGANVLLMSHAGGGYSVTNLTLTFDDAANNILPNSAPLTSGTYTPASYPGPVVFFAPAPAAPYGSTLGGVNGQSPNGVWSLYVLDDTAGDAGNIAGGWSLALTTTAPLPTDLVPIPATLTGSVVSNEFVLIVTAQGGLTYSIERSTNLTSWVSLSTNLVKIDGTFKFSDPESTNVTQRYYRAKRLAP